MIRSGITPKRRGSGQIDPKYPRSCGPCRECCIHLPIETLEKPAGVPCSNLCTRGCGIYGERPDVCRNFVCTWYQGEHSFSERPDKTGVVCWVSRKDDDMVLLVSYRKKLSKKMKRWISSQGPVIVRKMGE